MYKAWEAYLVFSYMANGICNLVNNMLESIKKKILQRKIEWERELLKRILFLISKLLKIPIIIYTDLLIYEDKNVILYIRCIIG